MKNLLYYLLMALMLVMVFTKCGGNDNDSRISKKDTTLMLGVYKADTANIVFGSMRRLVFDTLLPTAKDSMKNEWVRDTQYLIVTRIRVDTAKIEKVWQEMGIKKSVRDSFGDPNRVPVEFTYEKKYVRDGWYNLDSAVQQLKRVK